MGETHVTLPALTKPKARAEGEDDKSSGYRLLHKARRELTSLKKRNSLPENAPDSKCLTSLREKEQQIRAETARRLARQRKKRKELHLLRNSEIQRKLVENSAKIREHSRYLRHRSTLPRSNNKSETGNHPRTSSSVEVQSQYQIRPQPPLSAARSTKTYCVDNLSFSDCASSFHEGRELAYTLRMQLETNTLDQYSVISTQESSVSGLLDVPPGTNAAFTLPTPTPTPTPTPFMEHENNAKPTSSVSQDAKATTTMESSTAATPEEDSLQQTDIDRAVRPPLASISKENTCDTEACDNQCSPAPTRPKTPIRERQNPSKMRSKSLQSTNKLRPIPRARVKREDAFLPAKPHRMGFSVMRKVQKEDVELQARRQRECRRRQYNVILRARRKASVKRTPTATTLPAMKSTVVSQALQSAVTLISQEEKSLYKDLEDIDNKLASIKVAKSMQENTSLN